ncbi:MAG: hypothetical protein RLZZ499_2133 [Cyanobacteriota bacterium]
MNKKKLFHVSEQADINKFIPRPSPHTNQPVVWAIAENKLANYLLPRNCPRVAYCVGDQTSIADQRHFLSFSSQAIAIEALWYEQAINTTLYLYEMPAHTFNLFDYVAGYYVSYAVVFPEAKHIIDAPIQAILAKNIELRLLPSLWQLHDAVVNSTLEFSSIRMKNAQPKTTS